MQIILRMMHGGAKPQAVLTAPAANAQIPAANVSVPMSAADSDGTIAKVQSYRGRNLAPTGTSAPNTAIDVNVPPVSHSYTARAYDNAAALTTSAAVAVNVLGAR